MQSETQITALSPVSGLLFDPLPAETRERLIRFSIDEQNSVLLPLKQLTEILNIEASEILLIPEMPRSIIGICTWRTEMLWLVDLNQYVGQRSHCDRSDRLTILVMQQQHALGLAISQVHDIELHDLGRLQPPPIGLFSPELLPFIQGVLPGSSDAVLDLNPLLDSPLWKKYPMNEA
ncbi:chemotaxis protein CheW [Pseudanabaenaceae cyanobacterium LEGE 13415]|nr:chemotaxis protein CheW [Pseudanabaenaceae cyanobacterium LEGE 13415]